MIKRIGNSLLKEMNKLELNCKSFDNCVEAALHVLSSGGVIALPTDTVYGLASLLPNCDKIYQIKGRVHSKPLALAVADLQDIHRCSFVTVSDSLLSDLLPGPVTTVFKRRPVLPDFLNPGNELVGLRIPDHNFIRALCRAAGVPIALTSANVSNTQSTLDVQEFADLWPQLDLVVDGGRLEDSESARLGSTVVDLSQPDTFRIIRPGSAYHSTIKCLTSSKYSLQERNS